MQSEAAATGWGLRALALSTLFACYALAVLGDTVRVTDSGMGCRSWPLCNGSAGIGGTVHAVLEQSHRYLASIVSVLVLACAAWAWRSRGPDSVLRGAAVAAVALIVLQIALGALTVFAHNAGWTVAAHLAGAWLLLAAAAVFAVRAFAIAAAGGRELRSPAGSTRLRRAGGSSLIALSALFVLAVSGMLTLHEGATLACPSWPLCSGNFAPGGLIALQYLHRSLAALATVALAWAALHGVIAAGSGRLGRVAAALALVLLAATAAIGGVVATTGAPEWAQDLHLALATGLWVSAVVLAAEAIIDAPVPAAGSLPQSAQHSSVAAGPAPG